jgi:endonuclease/exonuclease/phosphatase family metal-dependent hydrolase
MGSSPMQTTTRVIEGSPAPRLRVLTYNVHSCRGTDRRHDPARIADVIAQSSPDVIALQELDVGRLRTGHVDQANLIADYLKMEAHFHPALHVEEEKYGDAILTALPSRLVRAAALPSIGEPRGALWIEIDFAGQKLQIVNTHFGLRPRERLTQAIELLGEGWLGSDRCRDNPTLFVGDLNAVPRSATYGLLARHMRAPSLAGGRRRAATFPSRFPLVRIDHVFTNEKLAIKEVAVVDSPLARVASDHLPLLATLECEAEIAQRKEADHAVDTDLRSARG